MKRKALVIALFATWMGGAQAQQTATPVVAMSSPVIAVTAAMRAPRWVGLRAPDRAAPGVWSSFEGATGFMPLRVGIDY